MKSSGLFLSSAAISFDAIALINARVHQAWTPLQRFPMGPEDFLNTGVWRTGGDSCRFFRGMKTSGWLAHSAVIGRLTR